MEIKMKICLLVTLSLIFILNSLAINSSFTNTTTPYDINVTNVSIVSPISSTKSMRHKADLPDSKESENEKHYSMTIFFILLVIAICICMIHLLLQTKFHYLPESVAIVLIGTFLGLIMKIVEMYEIADWKSIENFPPTMFFLILLPPIIFESGYNLHKGNFFQNIGSILVFAIFGTTISAIVVGGGIYLLGIADLVYKLSGPECFAFGSLISAVDPVATLAIFHAIEVDPVLYMLVFGESMLNDAVAIVLTTTVMESASPAMAEVSGAMMLLSGVGRFCLMFFASAAIGMMFGLTSALMLKFIDLRKTPSLEFGIILVFSYAPYGLAEGLHLSGIMAILACGIVMSHYTHLNLSPVVQITTQLTFRTIAFTAETCVFAYLGLAIFSFGHIVKPAFVIWSIILILIGRAVNIFPLSFAVNYFREHKITSKNQFIMWFSGLRGAVSFALSLHLDLKEEAKHVLVTTTLIDVLFTILFLGGSTMPLMKMLEAAQKKRKKKALSEVSLSKTKEMGETVDSEYVSELASEGEEEVGFVKPQLKGFIKYDVKYFIPFFTRKFSKQEVKDGQKQVSNLVKQWRDELRTKTTGNPNDDVTNNTNDVTTTRSNHGVIDDDDEDRSEEEEMEMMGSDEALLCSSQINQRTNNRTNQS